MEVLDFAINAVTVFGLVYVVATFGVFAAGKIFSRKGGATIAVLAPVELAPEPGADMVAERLVSLPIEPVRSAAKIRSVAAVSVVPTIQAEPSAKLNSEQLRVKCQAAGVKWRNARGKGKHLSKAEMLEALELS